MGERESQGEREGERGKVKKCRAMCADWCLAVCAQGKTGSGC